MEPRLVAGDHLFILGCDVAGLLFRGVTADDCEQTILIFEEELVAKNPIIIRV
jgi:hypothetical protein